jgi:methylmalonyl-CoA mutase
MYQRSKIQEESLYYETLKHTGEFQLLCKYILKFQRFSNSNSSRSNCATEEEKQYQLIYVE